MFKRATRLAAIAMAIAAAGCAGSDGSQGPQGPQGTQGTQGLPGQDLTAAAKPETCAFCHNGGTGGLANGASHQAVYDKYVAGGSLAVTTDSVVTGVDSVVTWTFDVTNGGAPVTDLKGLLGTTGTKTFYMGLYDPTASTTAAFSARTVPFGAPAHLSAAPDGQYVVTTMAGTWSPDTTTQPSYVYGYLVANPLNVEPAPSHITLYADVVNFSKTFPVAGSVDGYTSAANVSSCENCHGAPYRKHGYRMASVSGLPDFAACKACHYDSRAGGDADWQVMADDPVSYATSPVSAGQKAKYAYKAKLMNDVHMSHAMEFDYPQSMANCVTCHAGKLPRVTADENFTLETCRSCHPVTGPDSAHVDGARAPALITLMTNPALSYQHANQVANDAVTGVSKLYANASSPASCLGCHATSAAYAPPFSQIHSGYKTGSYLSSAAPYRATGAAVYTAAKNKYSDLFTASVDGATFSGSTLSVTYSATRTAVSDADPAMVGSIAPTLLVGLYGYDTKDFIVDPHTGSVLEWKFGSTANPRFKNSAKTVSGSTVTWTVDVDLSQWSPMFATTVRRAEIAVLPTLTDSTGKITYAINAPSKTFNFAKNAFETFFSPIVDANKCNKCHEALATTFHTPDRTGNVVVCRLCHNVRSGGFHLELQSRSIDSYIHAIHSFQQLDVGVAPSAYGQPTNFTDPVEAMRYGLKSEAIYPMFTLKNCESCHNPGTYDPPANDRSLPGVISGSWTNLTAARGIGAIPSYVTGAGSRACGSCHRAAAIREDVPAGVVINGAAVAGNPNAANDLTMDVQHGGDGGYILDYTSSALDAAIAKVQAFFK